jgi:hypothetical protein
MIAKGRTEKMNRVLIFLLSILLLSACSRAQRNQPAGRPRSPTDGGAADSSFAAAAAKVTDMCTLMPADLTQKIVPGGSAPQGEKFPLRCSVSNGKSVLEIEMDPGPTDPVRGAEFISGLAAGGYLERLDPVSRGDTYLTVILGKDPNWLLHVEVAGHDGKDHKDDAIAVAREILARLQQ